MRSYRGGGLASQGVARPDDPFQSYGTVRASCRNFIGLPAGFELEIDLPPTLKDVGFRLVLADDPAMRPEEYR